MRVEHDQLKAITVGDPPRQYREIARQHSPPRVRIWRGRVAAAVWLPWVEPPEGGTT